MKKLKEANRLYEKKFADEIRPTDNVRRRSARRRRKRRAKSLLKRARKSNVIATLQLHKNLAIQQTRASEQLYILRIRMQQSGVVL